MRQLVLFYVGKLFVCDHVLGQVIRVFVRQVRQRVWNVATALFNVIQNNYDLNRFKLKFNHL